MSFADSAQDRAFFGQPRGLAYLAFTELWERFSYYGMGSLLVLYMVQQVLLAGHIENVAGMGAVRGLLEGLSGPLSTQALASQLFGFYGGLVYFTPLIGGWLADRWFGAKAMVIAGVALMTAGHAAMVFEQSFLIALLLLILGSGALKGNIAAQVGQLYEKGDESRRARGFTTFSMFINIGGATGPLAAGALAQIYGWHYGFGLAGFLMLIAFGVYLSGQRHLPDRPPLRKKVSGQHSMTGSERRTMAVILAMLAMVVLAHYAYFQSLNVGFVWISAHVDLQTGIGTIPVAWFGSIDPIAGILTAPLLILWWQSQSMRGTEPDDLAKIMRGCALMSVAMLCFAGGAIDAGDGKASLLWPLVGYIASGFGFFWYWPVTLAFVSRRAPSSINAFAIGLTYITLFFASLFAGYFGSLYEALTPVPFFLLSAAIPAAGALLILTLGGTVRRALDSDASSVETTATSELQGQAV